jgi:hypothetical protein
MQPMKRKVRRRRVEVVPVVTQRQWTDLLRRLERVCRKDGMTAHLSTDDGLLCSCQTRTLS